MYGFDTYHCQAWPINPPCDSFSSISLSIFANWCWCRRWPYSHMLLINTAPPPFGNLAWLHRMGGSLVFFSLHPSCTHNTNKMKNVVILPRLDIDTKSRDNKEKKKKKELHQVKDLWHSKGNHQQNDKATYRMKEITCKSYIWQGVNIQNI